MKLVCLAFTIVLTLASVECFGQIRDTMSDTWAATDALGRTLPMYKDAGPQRKDRWIAMFYFLWHGAHINGGPYDISKILVKDPNAINDPNSPLWGPVGAPHHWGESIFGYYLTDDEWVIRKHAQMLTDAGVDVIVFDTTNQFTYQHEYMTLLKVYTEMRAQGAKTPQIAFLTPFWDPKRVVNELYKDLYGPGLFSDLWFKWDGKPLILANPDKLSETIVNAKQTYPAELSPGKTLGQSFTVAQAFRAVGANFPTWQTKTSGMTLVLRRNGPDGEIVAKKSYGNVADSQCQSIDTAKSWPAGTYYLEMSQPVGKIGWWGDPGSIFPGGQAFESGKPVTGSRTLTISLASDSDPIRSFFTFRNPQPDYFVGPTQPNMWSWLEVYPQHVFMNAAGQKEEMSVGVGQNALDTRLATFTEKGSHGRSFHNGVADTRPGAVKLGLNFEEQWKRALKEDPRVVFVTGWNEWIAGRFTEFVGAKLPVMFVDQFSEEGSRDIEPMKGGHTDNYYYQFINYVRKYKGVRKPQAASAKKTINVEGSFAQWETVKPDYLDDIGDTAHRDHRGWASAGPYVNNSGRNDFELMKVARDDHNVYFYVRTHNAVTMPDGTSWMVLLLDTDRQHGTGWEGYDFAVNRLRNGDGTTALERNVNGKWQWEHVADIKYKCAGNEMQVVVPRSLIALGKENGPLKLDFKWIDDMPESGDILDFLSYGDAAPNARFNYRFEE